VTEQYNPEDIYYSLRRPKNNYNYRHDHGHHRTDCRTDQKDYGDFRKDESRRKRQVILASDRRADQNEYSIAHLKDYFNGSLKRHRVDRTAFPVARKDMNDFDRSEERHHRLIANSKQDSSNAQKSAINPSNHDEETQIVTKKARVVILRPKPIIVGSPPMPSAPPAIAPSVASISKSPTEQKMNAEPTHVDSQKNMLDKSTVRCRYAPHCTNPTCPYLHPAALCSHFPNCRYSANKCMFIHPKCKFDEKCVNPLCIYSHSNYRGCSITQSFSHSNSSNVMFRPVNVSCRWGINCTRIDCVFVHPADGGSTHRNSRSLLFSQSNPLISLQQHAIDNLNNDLLDSENQIKKLGEIMWQEEKEFNERQQLSKMQNNQSDQKSQNDNGQQDEDTGNYDRGDEHNRSNSDIEIQSAQQIEVRI